jgi:ubiquinone/menaquinone biosynthesis C-methylase UbiE
LIEDASAWTVYWSNNTPQSCIASQQGSDADAINELWSDFAATLESGAVILDLATGNGAVPAAMLINDANYAITAVDQAHIDPIKFLNEPGQLQQVKFMGGIDVAQLPFADASFDAVSSQFGIEYAALSSVALEVFRVLKPGGQYQFLMHHSHSEIIGPNTLLISELQTTLEKDGLVDVVRNFVQGTCNNEQLEQRGQQYLNSEERKTKQISGQLFSAIGIISQTAAQNPTQAEVLLNELTNRLQAELTRLTQMQRAGLDEQGIQRFRVQLQKAGLVAQKAAAFAIGGDGEQVIVGWLLRGAKANML